MPSALGWYIHYNAKNYKKYGTALKTTNSENLAQICEKQRQSIHEQIRKLDNEAKVSDKDIELLEKFLNESKKQMALKQFSNSDSLRYEIEKKALKDLEDGLVNVNWDTLGVTKNAGYTEIGVGKQLRKYSATSPKTIQAALDKIEKLQTAIDKNLTKQMVPTTVIRDLKAMQHLYNQTNSLLEQTLDLPKSTVKSLQDAKIKLIQYLQTYVPYISTAQAQGMVFEYLLEKIPEYKDDVGRNIVDKELQTFINNIHKVTHQGTDKLSASIKVENIEWGFFQSGLTAEQKTEKRDSVLLDLKAKFADHQSADKIDISIDYKFDTKFNLSLKSYDLSKSNYLHLVDDSPLLYLIQDQNTDFVNHYFNIYSTHSEGGKSGQSARTFIEQARGLLKKEMQLTLMLKALTGINFDRTGANLLVLNDASSAFGGVKVYRMSSLMTKIEESLMQGHGPISITDENNRSWDSLPLYDNTWVGTAKKSGKHAQTRIQNILQQAYDRKIKVKLKIAIINGQPIHSPIFN